MTATFNVLYDPWIPVVDLHGSRKLLGIHELLRQAADLREISDSSPLEEFSLYRFISVFLMDSLKPKSEGSIRDLIRKGSFDMDLIDTYIRFCQNEGVSFDLFDKERPFMQSPYVKEWDKDPKPIAALDCMTPTGNNHIHCNHTREDDYSVTVDKAARLLLTFQQFCTVSLHDNYPNVNGTPPYYGVVKRPNLFETLVYTLVPLNQIDIPFDDPPVLWRSKEPVYCRGVVESTSWLRTMFFPPRRIRLFRPTVSGRIEKVYLSQGEHYTGTDTWTDPFVTYRTTKDGKRIPLRVNARKPIWRSCQDILDMEGQHASFLLSQYVRLSGEPYVEMTLYGVETDKAKYLDVVRHDLRFSTDILFNIEAVFLLKQSVEAAELLASRMRSCLNAVTAVSEQARDSAVNRFYDRAEVRFWQLCEAASAEPDIQAQYKQWCNDIGQYALSVFKDVLQQYHLRGKTLAQAADQQSWLEYEIYKLKNPKTEEE